MVAGWMASSPTNDHQYLNSATTNKHNRTNCGLMKQSQQNVSKIKPKYKDTKALNMLNFSA